MVIREMRQGMPICGEVQAFVIHGSAGSAACHGGVILSRQPGLYVLRKARIPLNYPAPGMD